MRPDDGGIERMPSGSVHIARILRDQAPARATEHSRKHKGEEGAEHAGAA